MSLRRCLTAGKQAEYMDSSPANPGYNTQQLAFISKKKKAKGMFYSDFDNTLTSK